MASPDYFSYFPNIDYAYKIDKAGRNTKIKIKMDEKNEKK